MKGGVIFFYFDEEIEEILYLWYPKLHGFCLKWRYADYGFLENLEAPCRRRSCAVAVARRRVPDWGFIGT